MSGCYSIVFLGVFIFFNVKIILMIRTVLSENSKTFLPLVKNQSTLLCIVYSIRTITVPRYQPHTLFIMKKRYSGKERHTPSRVLFSQVFYVGKQLPPLLKPTSLAHALSRRTVGVSLSGKESDSTLSNSFSLCQLE